MSLPSELSFVDVAKVLLADTGLLREEVYSLYGYQLSEDSIVSARYSEQSAEEREGNASPQAALTLDAEDAAEDYQPVFIQPVAWCREASDNTTIPQTSVSDSNLEQALLEAPACRWRKFDLDKPDLECKNLTSSTLVTQSQSFVQSLVHDRQQQYQAWCRALSKARVPRKKDLIEERNSRAESGDIWIIGDYADHLQVWWADIAKASANLLRHFGASRSNEVVLDKKVVSDAVSLPDLSYVLLLSDLGTLSTDEAKKGWYKCLNRWRQQGIQIFVVSPVEQKNQKTFLSWEPYRSTKAESCVEILLAGLSMLQWCSRDLLRYWRQSLGGVLLDEQRVWEHTDVWAEPQACGLKKGHAHYRHVFNQLPNDLQRGMLDAAQSFREGVAGTVFFEEALVASSVGVSSTEQEQLIQQNHQQLKRAHANGSLDVEQQRWLSRLSSRQEASFWQHHHELNDLCIAAREAVWGTKNGIPLGEGMRIASANTEKSLPLTVCHVGGKLSVVEGGASKGFEVFSFSEHQGNLKMQDALGRHRQFSSSSVLDIEAVQFPIKLSVAGRNITLDRVQKPSWAEEIACDKSGLWVRLPDDGRAYWGPDTPYAEILGSYQVRYAWVRDSQYQRLREVIGPPLWASHIEADDYGLYADLNYQGITQRMRWIPPGDFLMGSPEDEPERQDNETQHPVTLTQGFWLADTACTQALWQAVMGDNPSDFKGDDLPVENISWEDAQQFLKKLNGEFPGLQLTLPSEAQWEYACRAGTQTPFWWGDTLSTEQANYDSNHPYNNGAKGEYRKCTVSVKSFDANPWGLYQTHGNVWEWCQDRFAEEYPKGHGVDPLGPDKGDKRVLRGGCWDYSGQYLRAAYRNRYGPAFRYISFGFRFAEGLPNLGAESRRKD